MSKKKKQAEELAKIEREAQKIVWKYVKAVIQRDIVDIVAMNMSAGCRIRKKSKDTYTINGDDEVKQMEKKEEGRNKRSLRKIFRDLQFLITTNFANEDPELTKRQLFITLTYKENMTDPEQLHDDFRNFWKRLQRAYKGHDLDYISVAEPQGRGAWHIHLLLRSTSPLADDYKTQKRIHELWGHGLTWTERLGHVDNLGIYFIAYLSNAEITPERVKSMGIDENDLIEKEGKRYLKGTRMHMYKDYFKIYRTSKGIEKPKTTTDPEEIARIEKEYKRLRHIKIVEHEIEFERIQKEEKTKEVKNLAILYKQIGKLPKDNHGRVNQIADKINAKIETLNGED